VIQHAGLLALRLAEGWRGVLIEGASGSGKSDLALRALDAGWSLVADDQTLLWVSDDRLYGRAPEVLSGLIEARGLGVLPAAGRGFVEVSLVVRCVDAEEMERLPNDETQEVLGVTLPLVRLSALEASAPAKLSRALTHIGLRH
jgi:serine kinase of HPr protein (carbohydrate metabolism regulator)